MAQALCLGGAVKAPLRMVIAALDPMLDEKKTRTWLKPGSGIYYSNIKLWSYQRLK